MKRKKKSFYQKLYNFDKEDNAYKIEVSLDSYDDVYDEWDPSPFKKRDIEAEFNDFIFNSSEDIPLSFNINIVLYLPLSKKDASKEKNLLAAYLNYYEYELEKQRRKMHTLNSTTISFFILSLFFLSLGTFFFTEEQNVFLSIMQEGIFIGGWVFLWQVFTNMFIDRRELLTEYKLYQRLYTAKINFMYLET